MNRVLFFSLCIVSCWALYSTHDTIEFSSLNGKYADPCHIGLNGANPDCVYGARPDASVTVLVQSEGSFLAPGVGVMSLTGHAFPANIQIGLSTIGGRCSSIDATFNSPLVYNSAQQITLNIPATWNTIALELEAVPRAICYSIEANKWIYTGFKWKVVWTCSPGSDANLQCPPPVSSTEVKAVGAANRGVDVTRYSQYPMNSTYAAIRSAQTTCCISNNGPLIWTANQCVNPKFQACCGGGAYQIQTQKCCDVATQNVEFYDRVCRCTMDNTACPTGETCCLPSKYPELNNAIWKDKPGECYNAATHQCCDTGHRFDPGFQQCCVINGLQSLNTPCPCAINAHCVGDWVNKADDANYQCCKQTSPAPWESQFEKRQDNNLVYTCDKYVNYPSGTGAYQAQPCLGQCYNSVYQICCNGVSCLKNTEYCCNSTCCDKYVGTCAVARRAAAPGSFNNFNGFEETYQVCSTIEQMNVIRAFWVFVLPTELMFLTFIGLAIVLAFAARATNTHEFSILERIMIIAAVVTILFSVTLFFAPLWKYGVVIVLASFVAIITASARVRWLNVLCVFFQLVTLIYLFDFMHGNNYVMLPVSRVESTGVVDSQTSGILHTTAKMFKSVARVQAQQECYNYYNYFMFDPMTRDTQRYNNPEVTTFGYCSRGWVVALYLFEGGILDLVLLQIVLDLLALIVRFKEPSYDPIQAEKEVSY